MTMRHMNICSISLIIREKDIKTTMRYHFTRVRTAIIKNSTKKKKILERVWWKWNSSTVLGKWMLVQSLLKMVWRLLKKLKMELPHDPESLVGSRAFIQRKIWFKSIHAPHCSLQCCLQWPRHGRNLNVHQQMNG